MDSCRYFRSRRTCSLLWLSLRRCSSPLSRPWAESPSARLRLSLLFLHTCFSHTLLMWQKYLPDCRSHHSQSAHSARGGCSSRMRRCSDGSSICTKKQPEMSPAVRDVSQYPRNTGRALSKGSTHPSDRCYRESSEFDVAIDFPHALSNRFSTTPQFRFLKNASIYLLLPNAP